MQEHVKVNTVLFTIKGAKTTRSLLAKAMQSLLKKAREPPNKQSRLNKRKGLVKSLETSINNCNKGVCQT